MRVISNTSPVTNLAVVGYLDLLLALFGQITIASDVRDELVLGGGSNNPGADIVNTASWVHIEHADLLARDYLARQFPALDLGEATTLALAITQSTQLVLLDDRAARHAAASLALHYVGIVGVVLAAKARGLGSFDIFTATKRAHKRSGQSRERSGPVSRNARRCDESA